MKVEKDVMQEQREAEEELAVFMNRRLVKEVGDSSSPPLPSDESDARKISHEVNLPSTTSARTPEYQA